MADEDREKLPSEEVDAPSAPEGDPDARNEHGERSGTTAGQYGETSGRGDQIGPEPADSDD